MSLLLDQLDAACKAQPGCEMRFRLARPGRRVVLLAPHPDDEAIGAGGSLLLEARAGASTLVHFLTDGARGASGRGGEGELRRAEAAAAAEVLDLSGHLVSPWQSRDLRADGSAITRVLAAMLAALEPAEVWLPSPYEGHPTHLAATLIALQALQELRGVVPTDLKVLGYSTWDPIPAGPGVVVRDISSVTEAKRSAIRCHVSQCSVRAFDEAILARNRSEALLSVLTGEVAATHVEQFLDLTELIAASPSEVKRWMARRTEARFDQVQAQFSGSFSR